MNVLDLFSGIGGFSLGLERAGMRTVAFCEIDPYCRAVLRKHWPGVPIFEDVRKLTAADVGPVDVICGGFPCQDISNAGKKAGIDGDRSGLWSEYFRLIREIRPRIAVMENVSALLGRGLERVLGDLASIGYDAEWHCIPASAIGAPHERDRIWIVAYRYGDGESIGSINAETLCKPYLANAYCTQREGGWLSSRINQEYAHIVSSGWWEIEPDVGRVANGVPNGSHRLRALGNAVVPQIPEIIGRAIMKARTEVATA